METNKKQARSLRKLVTVTPLIDVEMINLIGEDLLKAINYLTKGWGQEFAINTVLPPNHANTLHRLRLLLEVFNNLKYGKPELCITDKNLWEKAEEEKNVELRNNKVKEDQAAMIKVQKLLEKFNKNEGSEKTLFSEGFKLLSKVDKQKIINQVNSVIYPKKGMYVLLTDSGASLMLIEAKYLMMPDETGACQCSSCKYAALPSSVSKGITYTSFCDTLAVAQKAEMNKLNKTIGANDAAA